MRLLASCGMRTARFLSLARFRKLASIDKPSYRSNAGVKSPVESLQKNKFGRYEVNLDYPITLGRIEHEVAAADLSLVRSAFLWKETLPDRFVGITCFASGIPLPHIFQCQQRALVTGVECAHCAGNVSQPWRRRFLFESRGRGLLRPIQRTDVDEPHAVEDIPYSA